MQNNIKSYFLKIWKARFFWTHLAFSDLRTKYRRSYLGIAWTTIQPLAIVAMLSFVLGKLLNQPVLDYALFIFSGFICWEMMITSTVGGTSIIVNSSGYVKQFRHPIIIYPLRLTIVAMINLLLASIGLLTVVIVFRSANLNVTWLSLIPAIGAFFLVSWSLSSIASLLGAKFRDLTQLIAITMQGLWYLSPVIFRPSMYRDAGLNFLVDWNPIYHLFQLVRAPLLDGNLPTINNVVFTLGLISFLWFITFIVVRRNEKNVIYYI